MQNIKKYFMTLALLITAATGAWAQTDVSTFADLQTALNAGNDVKLTANISFTSSITISGTKKITIDGNGKTMSGPSTRAFSISSGNTLVIKNATLDNFDLNAGGGAIRNNGTLVLDGCTVSNNHTDGSNQGGGAIENQGTLYASNTTFSGNYSSEIGGAINNYGGNLYLSGCTFTNNYTTSSNANYGGAIGNNSSNTLVLVNCTFSGNKYGGSNGTAGDLGVYRTPGTYTIAGCTGITIEGATLTTYQYGTATLDYSDLSAISFTYDQSDTPIAVASAVEVAWNKTEKTGTFDMPGGNVTLEPEYYPQATLTAAPTAADGAKATTDDLLVSGGTVATITGSDPAAPQGTLMYYVSTSTMTTEALLALDADEWVAEPTAAGITQKCGAFVYYYVKGNDSTDDALNFSDGDISSDNVLQVPIFPAPTYAVTFADDLAEPTLWTASPNADVTKGQTVTVTYSGTKKVIGVKAEKKAGAFAANEYNEASWDGTKVVFTKKTAASEPTAVADASTNQEWNAGWYTVSGNVTITGKVTLGADTHLILQDGATLTINGQLDCRTNGKNLYIYGQEKGDGKLNVTNNGANAINSNTGYRIDIHGGEVTASAAGVYNAGLFTGYLAVYGGKLTATSGGGNGIGFGNTIDVYGGEVVATSNATSDAYYGFRSSGSMDSQILTVYGGKVTATGNGRYYDPEYGSGFGCHVKSGTSGIKFYFSADGTTWGDGTSYDSATKVGTYDADAATKKRYAKAE